jgi:hypothetical protein
VGTAVFLAALFSKKNFAHASLPVFFFFYHNLLINNLERRAEPKSCSANFKWHYMILSYQPNEMIEDRSLNFPFLNNQIQSNHTAKTPVPTKHNPFQLYKQSNDTTRKTESSPILQKKKKKKTSTSQTWQKPLILSNSTSKTSISQDSHIPKTTFFPPNQQTGTNI